MPRSRPRVSRTPANPPPRDPPPGGGERFSPPALIGMGLGIYLVTLWFGIAVVGDTPIHSLVMAAVILALSAAGYFLSGASKKR